MCGGLTFGTKAPDGAVFSPLAVPAQAVFDVCLLTSSRARVVSRLAMIMLVLSPSATSKSRRGPSCLEITANDDAAFCCASRPYLAWACHSWQLPPLAAIVGVQSGQAESLRLTFSFLHGQLIASLQPSYLVIFLRVPFAPTHALREHLTALSLFVPPRVYR